MHIDQQNITHERLWESLYSNNIDIFEVSIFIHLTWGLSDHQQLLGFIKVFYQATLKLSIGSININQLGLNYEWLNFLLEVCFQAIIFHVLKQINECFPL